MSKQRQKEIEDLRSRIAALEADEQKESENQRMIASAHADLKATLEKSGISLDQYVKANIKEYRKILSALENKSASRSQRRVTTSSIKIPAGLYANIPSTPGKQFQVKEKGPRPVAVKAYAEEIGIDTFLSQCRISD